MARRALGILALAIVAAAIATSVRTPAASAFAWKTECYIFAWNGTDQLPVTGPLRLLEWTPASFADTNPTIAQALAVWGGVGLQPANSALTEETGFPITDGCNGTVTWTGAYGTLACDYSDPSSGSNSFDCSGDATNYQTPWLEDDDTLQVVIDFGGPSPLQGPMLPLGAVVHAAPHKPHVVKRHEDARARTAVLKASEAPRGGAWKKTTKFGDMGRLAKLWAAGKVPDNCPGAKGREGNPTGAASSLYVRAGGKEHAMSIVRTYKSAAAKLVGYEDVSAHRTIACLAAILRGGGKSRARTSLAKLSVGGLSVGAKRYRITVRYASGGVGYLDVATIPGARSWALMSFYREGSAPTDEGALDAAAAKVAARLP